MELEKYKVCPTCGEHNAPNLLECRKCETDLTGIKVVDSTTEQKESEKKSESDMVSVSGGASVLVRICECGAHNPPQARKCQECGEDISDILPTEVMQQEKKFSYSLKTVDGDFEVAMDQPVSIIGRESNLKEYLGSKMYVSRQHAKLTIVADKVMIENLSNTNRTFINNVAISGTEPVGLNDGDEIGLGGMEINGKRQKDAAYFLFSTKL